MKYHTPTNQFTFKADDLRRASSSLKWAIRKIRDASNLDPKGYKHDGVMGDPQFAESAIIQACEYLGIDLGADRYGKLDVSED